MSNAGTLLKIFNSLQIHLIHLTKSGVMLFEFYQCIFQQISERHNRGRQLAMPDGAAIAAASMAVEMQRINVVSHNLANTLTPAYKRM